MGKTSKALGAKEAEPSNPSLLPEVGKYKLEQEYNGPEDNEGVLRVEIDVQKYGGYESCRRLLATFHRRLGKERKFREIGYAVAFIVDKRIAGTDKKTNMWLEEFIRTEESEEDQTHQLREAVEILFTKAGAPRAKYREFGEQLANERFVYIDNMEIYGKYRMRGAGVQPMRMFLELLPQVLGNEGRQDVTCILSPARSASVKIKSDKNDEAVEAALIKSYQKNDFQLWARHDLGKGESAAYMGRMV